MYINLCQDNTIDKLDRDTGRHREEVTDRGTQKGIYETERRCRRREKKGRHSEIELEIEK